MVYVNIGTDDPTYHWKNYIPVKLTVHPETFKAFDKEYYDPNSIETYRELGTVDCSFGKSRKQIVISQRYQNGRLSLAGFIGTYETSKRLWRVAVYWNPISKKEFELWEGDEYRPNGSQQPLIYNPEIWKKLTAIDGRSVDEVKKYSK